MEIVESGVPRGSVLSPTVFLSPFYQRMVYFLLFQYVHFVKDLFTYISKFSFIQTSVISLIFSLWSIDQSGLLTNSFIVRAETSTFMLMTDILLSVLYIHFVVS